MHYNRIISERFSFTAIVIHSLPSFRTPITNVELLQKNLDQYWEESPPEVRRSYGLEYLKEFKGTVSSHMSKAKPREKIKEVVDDMVAAVAGTEPRVSYYYY